MPPGGNDTPKPLTLEQVEQKLENPDMKSGKLPGEQDVRDAYEKSAAKLREQFAKQISGLNPDPDVKKYVEGLLEQSLTNLAERRDHCLQQLQALNSGEGDARASAGLKTTERVRKLYGGVRFDKDGFIIDNQKPSPLAGLMKPGE